MTFKAGDIVTYTKDVYTEPVYARIRGTVGEFDGSRTYILIVDPTGYVAKAIKYQIKHLTPDQQEDYVLAKLEGRISVSEHLL